MSGKVVGTWSGEVDGGGCLYFKVSPDLAITELRNGIGPVWIKLGPTYTDHNGVACVDLILATREPTERGDG